MLKLNRNNQAIAIMKIGSRLAQEKRYEEAATKYTEAQQTATNVETTLNIKNCLAQALHAQAIQYGKTGKHVEAVVKLEQALANVNNQ